MKLNPHFKLRSIAGETIIVNQGVPDTDLTRNISSRAGRMRCGDLGRCTKKMFSLT